MHRKHAKRFPDRAISEVPPLRTSAIFVQQSRSKVDSFESVIEQPITLTKMKRVDKGSERAIEGRSCSRQRAGTTGAGDAAHAGLLTGLQHGLTPEATVRGAVAVGTCNVKAPDATSGIPDRERIQARLQSGWEQRSFKMAHPGWKWREEAGIWVGPEDSP